jgi:hypothetical protein
LDEVSIPHKTVHRVDHLFNFSNQAPYEIGVPASLYKKAEQAVVDAFGTDEETGEDAIPLLPEPEMSGPPPQLRELNQDPEEWFEEDAKAEVWTGDSPEMREIIEMSLRENDIRTRWVDSEEKSVVFVLPADESRAREIVREILESTPLE